MVLDCILSLSAIPVTCGISLYFVFVYCTSNLWYLTVFQVYTAINTDGCTDAFVKYLAENLDTVGATALGFAIPQVFCLKKAHHDQSNISSYIYMYIYIYIYI